jgi:hypothetical protein
MLRGRPGARRPSPDCPVFRVPPDAMLSPMLFMHPIAAAIRAATAAQEPP